MGLGGLELGLADLDRLEEGVLLAGCDKALEAEGPAFGYARWEGCAIKRQPVRSTYIVRIGHEPDVDSGLVDVLGLDRLGERRHALVVFVRVPVACPPALAVLGLDVVVERRHRHVCCKDEH